MREDCIEGIVLRSTPYKDHHRVVTLFTPHVGMISCLVKQVKSPEKLSLVAPFSHIELIYKKKQSDLYHFKDGTLLSDHHFLREKWDYLEAAGKMGHLLLRSQLPGKGAPRLYALFMQCLKQLPLFDEPATLLLLFYVKFLSHEGVWDPDHRESPILEQIATTRSFQSLQKKRGLKPLLDKIENGVVRDCMH